MIFTPGNEYTAVLDACVLVPAALCDLLLRLAEEPATYRPVWGEEILSELGRALRTKLGRTPAEVGYRLQQMKAAFPEALVYVPQGLVLGIKGIPDEADRHVLATAIVAHATVIVTQNIKHFPKNCLEEFGVDCQTADEFLIHQLELGAQLVRDKLDEQGAAIGKDREFVIASLKQSAPRFADMVGGER